MKTKLVCILMFFSTTAFAQTATTNEQEWEGATLQVPSENVASTQGAHDDAEQLELSQPWHYGRDDSDTIVGRKRGYEY